MCLWVSKGEMNLLIIASINTLRYRKQSWEVKVHYGSSHVSYRGQYAHVDKIEFLRYNPKTMQNAVTLTLLLLF